MNSRHQPIATFSIVAHDPQNNEWGIGVQSKFLAVGAVVPWARAGVGAVATQSYANLAYGPDGLDMMAQGASAQATIDALTSADKERNLRQMGMVDAKGQAASFTGSGCYDWAGHIVEDGFCCQGNILVPSTVEAMAEYFAQARQGAGELADWLVEALLAGQAAGGDSRGRQAAAVLVVREGGGYGGNNDRYLDLRVDDDPFPIQRLKQLVDMHHLYFGNVDPDDHLSLSDTALVTEFQAMLQRTGHYSGDVTGTFDDATRSALRALVGSENLEERWNGTGDAIDRQVVIYLRGRFGVKE
ncbi:MAG: DUF1028 domain-containing protein [Chloroflexota bacterium]